MVQVSCIAVFLGSGDDVYLVQYGSGNADRGHEISTVSGRSLALTVQLSNTAEHRHEVYIAHKVLRRSCFYLLDEKITTGVFLRKYRVKRPYVKAWRVRCGGSIIVRE